MRRIIKAVYPNVFAAAVGFLPTIAMGENLLISVVDDSKHGISSDIYQGGAAEVIIGRTKGDGTLVVPSYKCNYDKPLKAMPIDTSHFFPDQEPCKTPLNFLVHSRITPNGTIAFNRITRGVKFDDGSDGRVDYVLAMNVDKSVAKLPGGKSDWDGCKLDYNIEGYGTVSKLSAGGWMNVSRSQESATNVFSFDEKNINQLKQHKALLAEKNDQGIAVFVPGDCLNVTAKVTDEFASVIKEAVDQKVRDGNYKTPKDFTQFAPK
jgi:hypothetical protein